MTWVAAALTPSSSPFHTITEPDRHGDDDEGNDPAAAAAAARGFAAGGGGVEVCMWTGWSKMEGSSGWLYGRHKDTQRLISK